MIFQAYPKAAEVQDIFGMLPLHYAVASEASYDVISKLLHAYPEATVVRNRDGELPSDVALRKNPSSDVTPMLMDVQKKVATKPSTAVNLNSYKLSSRDKVETEKQSTASTTTSSIEASSNFIETSREFPVLQRFQRQLKIMVGTGKMKESTLIIRRSFR
jgi:hypothetical protein